MLPDLVWIFGVGILISVIDVLWAYKGKRIHTKYRWWLFLVKSLVVWIILIPAVEIHLCNIYREYRSTSPRSVVMLYILLGGYAISIFTIWYIMYRTVDRVYEIIGKQPNNKGRLSAFVGFSIIFALPIIAYGYILVFIVGK